MRDAVTPSHTRGMEPRNASPVEPVVEPPGARPLSGAPRPVRHLAPPEVPWPGRRAAAGDASCFLVDAPVLRSWPGWDADPGGHLLAPIDIVRRSDGHDVVLPLCTERLVRFLQRRAARQAPVSAGEAITVLVSVLRGTAEALARSPFATGEWWLTDAGKPVFAYGDGPDAAMAADLCLAALGDVLPETAELRDRLGGGADTSRGSGAADLAHPRALATALPEIEAALFARNAPEPLATTDLAPARARSVSAAAEHTNDVVAHSTRGHWSSLSRLVDGDASELLAAGWDALRERRRAVSKPTGSGMRGPRRGVVLVAAASALAVAGIGLLWPHAGADRPAAHAGGGAAAAQVASSTATPSTSRRVPSPTSAPSSPSPTSGVSDGSDVAAVVRGLLAARIACGDDVACRGSYAEDPTRRLPPGAIDDPQQAVVLLDDFGGAAVARVTSAGREGSGRRQLVLVVRTNQKWLIRDVDDVADQPK